MQTLCLILASGPRRQDYCSMGSGGFANSWEISEDVATAGGGKLNNENHFVALCGNVSLVVVGAFVAEI